MGSFSLTRIMLLHIPITFVVLSSIYSLGDAIFFGPSAVGLGIGLIAAKKGFLLGTYLANRRSRRSYNTRRYSYQPRHHYNSNYNGWYSKPRRHYYYSSNSYNRHGGYRGKRDTVTVEFNSELHELHRIKREIEANGLDMNKFYKDMTENDQDSCGKKLICELRSKQASGVITDEEAIIAESFGQKSVDVSDITVEFDLASQIGKFMGKGRCEELYHRCDISTNDMVNMIAKEYENLELLRSDLDENEFTIDNEIELEAKDLKKELESINKDDRKDSWVWA